METGVAKRAYDELTDIQVHSYVLCAYMYVHIMYIYY